MWICFDFRENDTLRAACNSGHQCQIAAIATHHLDKKRPLMRRGGHLESVDGFQCNIQGAVDTNSDFRAAQIVVECGGHADQRKSLLPKCPRSSLGAVSTNHN